MAAKETRWTLLQQLCEADEQFYNSWCEIYENVFPFPIRYNLGEEFDNINWEDLTEDDAGGKEVLQLLQKKSKDIYPRLSLPEKHHMMEGFSNLQKRYKENAGEMVKIVQKCLEYEKRLVFKTQRRHGPDETMDVDEETIMKDEGQPRQLIHQLQEAVKETENCMSEVENCFNNLHQAYHELQAEQEKAENNSLTAIVRGRLNTAAQAAVQEKHTTYCQAKEKMFMYLKNTVAVLVPKLLQVIWNEVSDWHMRELQIIAGMGVPKIGALSVLNTWCEAASRCMMELLNIINKAIAIISHETSALTDYQTELKSCLIKHLQKCFVFVKQPERIINQNKSSNNFSVEVKILGGKALNLQLEQNSDVSAQIHEGDHIQQLVDNPTMDIKKVNPGAPQLDSRRNVLDSTTFSVKLSNLVVKGGKNQGKKSKTDWRVDRLYGIIVSTAVLMQGQQIPLKTFSTPFVITTHMSQHNAAKGNIIWDAAFAAKGRRPYQSKKQVTWDEMAGLLSTYHCAHLQKDLSSKQLENMKDKLCTDGNDQQISREDFIKQMKTTGKSGKKDTELFSFWRWFSGGINLLKTDAVNGAFGMGIVYGFLSRKEAISMLENMEDGTFIVRLKDSEVEKSESADPPGKLCVSVVITDPYTGERGVRHFGRHMKFDEIKRYGLLYTLYGMIEEGPEKTIIRLLKYAYPDTDLKDLLDLPKVDADTGGADADETYPDKSVEKDDIFLKVSIFKKNGASCRRSSLNCGRQWDTESESSMRQADDRGQYDTASPSTLPNSTPGHSNFEDDAEMSPYDQHVILELPSEFLPKQANADLVEGQQVKQLKICLPGMEQVYQGSPNVDMQQLEKLLAKLNLFRVNETSLSANCPEVLDDLCTDYNVQPQAPAPVDEIQNFLMENGLWYDYEVIFYLFV